MRRGRTIFAVATMLWAFRLGVFNVGFADDKGQPAISVQEATRIVQEHFPGARILEVKLATEDGRLVYEVELVTAEGQKKELHLDAMSGKIVKTEHD
ncbi:MAG: hypothetical protein C4293_18230 [Nitrospiraceae bacterium]